MLSYLSETIKKLGSFSVDSLLTQEGALKVLSAGLLGGSLLYLGRKYFKGPFVSSRLLEESNLKGQVVLVTGASKNGIGFETVKTLYLLGATVIMAVRDTSRSEKEKKELEKECQTLFDSDQKKYKKGGKLIVMKLNLEDLESVREFSSEFLKTFTRLDILVNNAGLGQGPALSKQGIEIHFAVNHLGHFLLVQHLRQLIIDTSLLFKKPCKIINVSSVAHTIVKRENQMLTKEQLFKDSTDLPMMFAYGHSKLCNILLAKSLTRQFEKSNLSIGCYALHPGAVSTNVFRHVGGVLGMLLNAVGLYFFKTPESGAQTQILLCLEKNENLKNGGYYQDCKCAGESALSKDVQVQDNLWKVSEELCKEFATL